MTTAKIDCGEGCTVSFAEGLILRGKCAESFDFYPERPTEAGAALWKYHHDKMKAFLFGVDPSGGERAIPV